MTFEEARECVLREVRAALRAPAVEPILVLRAAGRILGEEIVADRDYPPFPRSARDGYAVRSADLPGALRIIGEARAGAEFEGGAIRSGECIEIMTGAPLPRGADQVVMLEHATRDGYGVRVAKKPKPGDAFTGQGEEAEKGSVLLGPGKRIGHADVATLAMVGRETVSVYAKPRVSILPTGDELVEVNQAPGPHQIRNSNAWSLAVQVESAGGVPELVGIARDNYESTRELIEKALDADLLLLSGGVSVGKYDIVERVLADLGARFFFTQVHLQPGKPVVFGTVRGKFFFGLPGNPGSTMATFEIFARAAVELLAGLKEPSLRMMRAKLTEDFEQKTGLTRFLPARLSDDGSSVTPLSHHGSGDVPALARANAYLVTDPDREVWAAGEDIRVLVK